MSVLKAEIECDETANMREHNRVDYGESQDLGMVTRRQHQIAFAPHKSYTASTSASFEPVIPAPIDIEIKISGSDFVDGRNSWLYFKLKSNVDSNPKYSYGNGSALNWVKAIKILGSDGQTIDDLSSSNLYMTHRDRWSNSSGYFNVDQESVGELKGYGLGVKDGGFVCPLSDLIPLFNYDKLLPSNLLNGMRIILTLAPPHEVFKHDIGIALTADVNYELSDIRLMLDTYVMDTKIQQTLTQSEIIIEYDTYKTQTKMYESQTLRMPLTYSVAKASHAFVVAHWVSTVDDDEQKEKESLALDYMAGEDPLSLDEYRWRIGNQFQPNIPIKNDVEALAHALTVFNKLTTNLGNISISPASFSATQNCFCVNLRRAGGGTPINNGNQLELQLSHKTTDRRLATMFCVYKKQLRLKPVTEIERLNGYTPKLAILE